MKRLFQLLTKKIGQLIVGIREIPYRKIALDILKFIGDIMHRALFEVLLPKRLRNLTKQEIYDIIFKADTPRGKKFDVWLLVLITINILVIIMESIAITPEFENMTSIMLSNNAVTDTIIDASGNTAVIDGTLADGIDTTHHFNWFVAILRVIGFMFTILFTFEFYLRIYCLDKPKPYLTSFFGIIDMVSIFPAYLSPFFPAATTLSALRLMRVLRIFRIYKMQKFIDESLFMVNALKRSFIKILVFMLFVFVMAIILGSTMYGIEGSKNPAISSIPRGIYWAVVTITTVGYGDITPVTSLGQFVSVVVMLLGYSIIAVPTGIVAGETIEEHKRERHRKKKKHELANEAPNNTPADIAPENPAPTSIDPGVHAKPEDLL
ncbi:MAG: ion transporter [Bacteroidales bacterium]|nr:ion transporter [Bacteroidales bacterium]